MAKWSIDIDAWARRSAETGNIFVVAVLLDIMGEIIELDIIDTGTWRGSWYARKGDVPGIPITDDTNTSRSSASEILLELRGHSLGDTYTFINGTTYAAPLEFKPGNAHEGKVRGVLGRADQIARQTGLRFR